jgi:glycosyltransferase involved in cell wall biosynthesis
MTNPEIDVVMTVYNSETYVTAAVNSILAQTYSRLRLICVDDGSTDNSSRILASLARRDQRVHVVTQKNQGIVGAANTGISLCTAPLIARIDHDDIALPQRFEKQVAYLQKHPEVVAVGTGILEIDADGDALGVTTVPVDHDDIERLLLNLGMGMANPSVMMRTDAVKSIGGYRSEFELVDDMDLWLRLAEIGRLANLPDILQCYRQYATNSTWSAGSERSERILASLRQAYERRGRALPDQIVKRCLCRRSAAGPMKWARKASRQGLWRIAAKHTRKQWADAPLSLVTWRMTLEVLARSAASALTNRQEHIPDVPFQNEAA